MKAISRAINRDDRETLRRAAHKLRGEAVTLDFRVSHSNCRCWRAKRIRWRRNSLRC